jgi:hypothetical protein
MKRIKMKTKQEIIQRLLDDKHITVEEAMSLLETTQYVLPFPSGYWTSTVTGVDKMMTADAINSANEQARKTILND